VAQFRLVGGQDREIDQWGGDAVSDATTDALTAFRDRWPRMYLDTADLHEIARGRVDAALLADFFGALKEHAVILVVSLEHLRDALKPGDAEAPKRFGDALLRFPLLGLVDLGPDRIEPWPGTDIVDIKIDPWGNVHEVLQAPTAAPALATQAEIQAAMHAGEVAANQAMRITHRRRVPRRLHPVFAGATVTLLLGWRGNDAATVLDWVAAEERLTLTAAERADLAEQLQPVVEMVRRIGPMMQEHNTDRVAAMRRVGLGPERAPGYWLAGKLSTNRMRNVTRDPIASDSIDLLHASYFPYMDIAECDRQAHDALQSNLGEARGPRTCHLFRNGQLRAILEHVRTLPTGVELTALAQST
jgi:hypothetical protein